MLRQTQILGRIEESIRGRDEIGRLPVLRSPGSKERAGSSPVARTKLESSDECYGFVNVSKELHR